MSVILNANILFVYSIVSTLVVTYKIIRVRVCDDRGNPVDIRRIWYTQPHPSIQNYRLANLNSMEIQ